MMAADRVASPLMVVAFKTLRVVTVVVPPEIVPDTTRLLEMIAADRVASPLIVVAFLTLRVVTVVVPPEIVPETTRLLEMMAEEVEKVPVKVSKVRLEDAPGDPD
jgi:hypothetical protein